jgi:hypothetical protein
MSVFVLMADPWRKHKCSEEFVDDLRERIMRPALAELNHCFGGQRWVRTIKPYLTLEGPSVDFQISIIKIEGWELMEMNSRISEVFNKYWDQEIDRIPPR